MVYSMRLADNKILKIKENRFIIKKKEEEHRQFILSFIKNFKDYKL